jgi:hypothetical protein
MKSIINIYDYYVEKYTKMTKLYDVFLSHKQSEAQDRAKVYKLFLKEKGINAFYDKDELTDDDWTIEKLIEVVSRSKCLFFFYTPTILENLWCQLELLIAIKSKIPIFIINVEPTWPKTHLTIKKSDFPSYLKSALTKNNVINDHRYQFDKLEIQILNILSKNINKQQNKTKKHKKHKNKTIKK